MEIAIRDVGVRFGALWANRNLSFTVAAGAITAVIGPNGAGKSTLFNVITGFTRPTEGEVRLNGRTISGLRPEAIAALGVGRTFQTPEICGDMTLFENVLTGAHRMVTGGLFGQLLGFPAARRSAAAARASAGRQIARCGLHRLADVRCDSLPLGKLRLLEIARALALAPGLLLLDEAASGLNSQEAAELARLIAALPAGGVTVVLIEHNIGFVMALAQRIVVLDGGRLLGIGTPGEIRQNQQVIDAYLGTRREAC